MTFASSLAAGDTFNHNVVIKMRGVYYARHQPDSGLTVPAANRIVGEFDLSPQTVDVEDVKTSFATYNFELIDKAQLVTGDFLDNLNIFMNEKVEVWLGRVDEAMAFADYFKLQNSFTP